MKVKNAIKKVGAAAGSALMVGMTMGAAQATANTLGDFPQPFVTDDGQVQSQIVVGSQGKQADVVGAINVAAALGQSAVQTETKTKTVSAGGTGTFGWSASGGQTLDTSNDKVYFGQNITEVRDTLTSDQLEQLRTTTFQDDSGDETDIENYLYPGDQQVQFGKPSDRNNQDPVVYVSNPADPSASNYLYRLQANMEDEIAFNASDVEDEEIQLFGDTWTVSTDTTGTELHLLGSQQTVSVDTGKSKTITVGGSEVTIEAVSASDSDTGSFRVNGELKEKDEEQTVTVNGQEIRLDEVVQTGGNDSGTGVLQFAVGSDEFVLQHGQQIEDDDGDDIDGTYVEFDSSSDGNSDRVDDISSIDVYVGSNSDDHEYVTPAEDGMYQHPMFEDYTFRFKGLNPDASQGSGDNVGEVAFSTSGDDQVTVDFTSRDGSSASVEFLHNASGTVSLADDDGDSMVVEENASIHEDEYFASDAGDFPHLWEVTNIDRDTDGSSSTNISSSDEAQISLRDAVSGSTVTVDLDAESGAPAPGEVEDYADTEVIDGQTYKFLLDGSSSGDLSGGFKVAWGDSSAVNDGSSGGDAALDVGNEKTLYAPLDTKSVSAVAFTENVTTATGIDVDGGDTFFNTTLELPSTESTDAKTVDITIDDGPSGSSNGYNFTVGSETTDVGTGDGVLEHTVGQTTYTFKVVQHGASDNDLLVGVSSDQADANNDDIAGPGSLVVLPEDDADEEHSYFVTSGYDSGDGEITVQDATYSGGATTTRQTSTLESDDDVTAGMDFFGAHTLFNTDNQQSFTLHIPSGQATVGAAFTGPEGSLTAGGGGGSSSVTYTALAGTQSLPSMAMLDTEVTSSVRQNSHLILVGGPAVNQLVADLAQDNSGVWTAQQWRSQSSQGNARLNLVNDAFASGQDALIVAGYSADDTRGAARYIANYEANQANLQGKNTVSLSSADYPTAQ